MFTHCTFVVAAQAAHETNPNPSRAAQRRPPHPKPQEGLAGSACSVGPACTFFCSRDTARPHRKAETSRFSWQRAGAFARFHVLAVAAQLPPRHCLPRPCLGHAPNLVPHRPDAGGALDAVAANSYHNTYLVHNAEATNHCRCTLQYHIPMLFLIFFEFSYLMNNCSAGRWSTRSHTPSVLRLRYKTVANLTIWQGAILEIVKLALPQVPYHWLADERRNAEKTMRRTREHIPSGISTSITFRDGMQWEF